MLTVFYGNQVYGEYPDWKSLRAARLEGEVSSEVYNNAVIHCDEPEFTRYSYWWRSDGLPMLLEDVSAICKAWMLIL